MQEPQSCEIAAGGWFVSKQAGNHVFFFNAVKHAVCWSTNLPCCCLCERLYKWMHYSANPLSMHLYSFSTLKTISSNILKMRAMKELLQNNVALITANNKVYIARSCIILEKIATFPIKTHCKSILPFVFNLIINLLKTNFYIEHEWCFKTR